MKAVGPVKASLQSQRVSVCKACRLRLATQTRYYAAPAEAAVPSTIVEHAASDVTQTGSRKAYRLNIAPVVSRPPLLTRELTSFEKAFYLYQKRLNDRLALPPTRYFYYQKGTPSDIEWKRKIKARKTAARDIGVYSAYGREGWQDEVLLGDKTAEPENIIESLVRDAEGKTIVGAQSVEDKDLDGAVIAGDASIGEGTQKRLEVQVDRPLSRATEADAQNDTKSLNRKLDRSLYLLVKNKSGSWRFPEDYLFSKESLYQAAERILVQAAGVDMNTWVVGNHPIGFYQYDYLEPRENTVPKHRKEDVESQDIRQLEYGGKVFFMKTRIMAGQASLAKNIFGHTDFAWLAKEEVQEHVSPAYWSYVENMLTDR